MIKNIVIIFLTITTTSAWNPKLIRMIHESTTLEIMESRENSFYDGAPVYTVYGRNRLRWKFTARTVKLQGENKTILT